MVFAAFELLLGRRALEPKGAVLGAGKKRVRKRLKRTVVSSAPAAPAAWGHLRDWRLNYPEASAARKIRRTRGEDEAS